MFYSALYLLHQAKNQHNSVIVQEAGLRLGSGSVLHHSRSLIVLGPKYVLCEESTLGGGLCWFPALGPN